MEHKPVWGAWRLQYVSMVCESCLDKEMERQEYATPEAMEPWLLWQSQSLQHRNALCTGVGNVSPAR